MWEYRNSDELYHWGVLGMRWGHRKGKYTKRLTRLHGGPGIRFGTKRQLSGDKEDLKYLKNGGHLSIGLTKKRQAAYDARDKKLIEARIKKNQDKLNRNKESRDYRRSKAIQKKSIKSMSNRELDIVNNRLTKEKNYRTNKVDKYLKGAIIVRRLLF